MKNKVCQAGYGVSSKEWWLLLIGWSVEISGHVHPPEADFFKMLLEDDFGFPKN